MIVQRIAVVAAAAALASFYSTRPSHALTGCYYGGGHYSPIQIGVSYPEIDVYVDDSFYNAQSVGGLSPQDAEFLVKQTFARFQSESGSTFNFRWQGHSQNLECDGVKGSSTQYAKPTIIVNGDPDGSYCGGNVSACAWFEQKAANTSMNCGRIHFVLNASFQHYSGGGNEFTGLLMHEIMHVFGLNHQNDAVNCPTNLDDISVVSGDGLFRHLTRADKRYLRMDYGYGEHDVIENHGEGFGPASWTDDLLLSGGSLTTAAATDGDDSASGYAVNFNAGGDQPEVRVKLYESQWLALQTPSAWDSYHRVDIARSIGHSPDKWMVAFLAGDSPESRTKDIRISEKTFGQAGWTESWLDVNTTNSSVALAYDPLSDRFVVTFLDSDDNIRVSVREVGGGSWSNPVSIGVDAFDGLDIACSQFLHSGKNCIVAYVDTDPQGTIHHRHIRVYGGGGLTLGSVVDNGWLGYSMPSVTVNPLDEDPKFYLAFSQGGQTVYTRYQNRDSQAWSGGTAVVAPSLNWYPPARLGVFLLADPETDLMIGDD